MATDDAIAAGGNKGSISRNQFAPKILNSGTGANLWPLAIAAALILVAVKIRFKLPKPKRK
ncbi:MAG: hypothetical protein K9M45_01610 [Kiritimatiellales bacterium]|nr:hypothetical protein [Kiritimatiellales bacterium]